MPDIKCRTCKQSFESWGNLAHHINSSKDKAHNKDRAGKMWAKRFIHKNTINKMQKSVRKEFAPRTALSDEQKEAKKDTRRELSGEMKIVPVKCLRCHTGSRQFLEAEHVNNPDALIIDNCYVKMCEGCR